ncbi:hypothetical protein RQN30_03165 [Arcanobacterium hippocoleae]
MGWARVTGRVCLPVRRDGGLVGVDSAMVTFTPTASLIIDPLEPAVIMPAPVVVEAPAGVLPVVELVTAEAAGWVWTVRITAQFEGSRFSFGPAVLELVDGQVFDLSQIAVADPATPGVFHSHP